MASCKVLAGAVHGTSMYVSVIASCMQDRVDMADVESRAAGVASHSADVPIITPMMRLGSAIVVCNSLLV